MTRCATRSSTFAQECPVGHGLEESSVLGPIQNRCNTTRSSDLVEDAKRKGARLPVRWRSAGRCWFFYPVTIVADVDRRQCRMVDEEQFGPVLPVIRYADARRRDRARQRTRVGLGGSVWSADIEKAKAGRFRLECGTAWINKHGAIKPNAPFGGVKGSGIGVEFGEWA